MRRGHLLRLSIILLFLVSLLFYPEPESYVYAQLQPSLTIRQVSPPDGATIPYTPIQLRIDVESEGIGIEGAAVTFYLDDKPIDEEVEEHGNGKFSVWTTPTSGAHSWYATAEKTGYTPTTSETRTLTHGTPPVTRLRCTLVSPSDGFTVTTTPIELKARVTEHGAGVEGAQVDFYVNNAHRGHNHTNSEGYAIKEVDYGYGTHSWYAIATMEGYTPATSEMWSFTYTEEHTYVIFEDDFEDGEAEDWELSVPPDAPPGSAWGVELEDGNYVLSGEGHCWSEAGDEEWTDYTLELKVKLVKGGGLINFRMTPKREGPDRYFLRLSRYDLTLVKWSWPPYLGEPRHTELKRVGLDLDPDAWYTVKIVCIGNNLKTYLDDDLKVDYTDEDDPFLSGNIGLEPLLYDEKRLSHVLFDDIKVSVEAYTVDFSVDPPDAGYVRVDGNDYYDGDSTTFPEGSHAIKAVPYSGYGFESWDCGAGVDVSATTTMYVGGDGWLQANFQTKVEEEVEHTYVVFQDDFEDGDAEDWDIHEDPGSDWRVEREGENYVLSCEGHCFGRAGDEEWTDYTLELKFRLIKGHVWINFRMTMKPEAPDRYHVVLDRYDLSLVRGELYLKEPRHTELKHVSVDFDPDTWYDVKILCIGNNIKVYLDDVLKIDYTDEDDPFLSGCIGFEPFFYDENKPSHVFFDDVKVSTTHRLYVAHLIKEAQDEINDAKRVGADTSEAEEKLAKAQTAFDEEDLSWAESLAKEAIDLAKQAYEGSGEGWPVPTSLSCRLSSHDITEGDSITLTGTITPAITKELLIVFAYDGEKWEYKVRPSPDGKLSNTWEPPHPGEYEVKVHWPGDERYETSDWVDFFGVKSREGPTPPTGPPEPAGPPIGIQTIVPPAIILMVILAVVWARRRRRPPPVAVPVPPSPVEARALKVRRALARLEEMGRQGRVSAQVYQDLRAEYEAELRDLEGRIGR
ncbi:MAG: family 16 glycoside hydrolase [Candidatus Bathyarchaeia archaeon]